MRPLTKREIKQIYGSSKKERRKKQDESSGRLMLMDAVVEGFLNKMKGWNKTDNG